MYDMLKKKKCPNVDTPQLKHLRQVRIEFKIAALRLIELNNIFASSTVSIESKPTPCRKINFWCEFSFKMRKDAVATFSNDVITTRPHKHFSSGS